MREYDRAILRERIDREGATVGATIPATVVFEDRTIDLRERILDLTAHEELTVDQRSEVVTLKRGLRRRRHDLVDELDYDALTLDEGEELVDRIAGIDRALNALDQLGEPSVTEQANRRREMDRRRWMDFLREALGQSDDRRR